MLVVLVALVSLGGTVGRLAEAVEEE